MRRSDADTLIGRVIANKFAIESLLGQGAMGAVYRARQIALEKMVAIKVLHGEHADDATFAARFHREAKAASRLNHPNSIQIIDFGEEPDGLLYIAMEYLDGIDLHRTIERDWPLPDERIIDILSQVLAALSVAHEMRVVHRDLKPENIMITTNVDDEGRPHDLVKVCDFGIAKLTESIPPPPPPSPGGVVSPAARALTTRDRRWDARVHGARAVSRRDARRADRFLRGGRDPLSAPRGSHSVSGRQSDRSRADARRDRARAADADQSERVAAARSGLPKGVEEDARGALRERSERCAPIFEAAREVRTAGDIRRR